MTPRPDALVAPGPPTLPLALVAGGSRGLGLLIARELGRRGHRLMLWARDEQELQRAADDLAGRGCSVSTAVCDVADVARVEQLVAETEEAEGPIEVLVVVAGIIQVGPLASLTRVHLTEAVDVMLWGPINLALAVVPAMRARKRGRIGVITSIGGLVSVPHLLAYSTAKFGAVGFTSGLRSELAGSGVKVTTVAPGLMRTGSHLRAQFFGDQPREYAWFSLGASLPLVSMDAERAARAIVTGVLAGRAMVVLTPLAQVGMRVNALFPGLTASALGVMSRLLPAPPPAESATTGQTLEGHEARVTLRPRTRRLLGRLTALGERAAERFHELPPR